MNNEEGASLLIIGGTTEGRLAASVCDEAGKPFYYSTKGASQTLEGKHLKPITGGMDARGMISFCRQEGVQLLVDAAHPFALTTHRNIGQAGTELNIPIIRIERDYTAQIPKDNVVFVDNYKEGVEYLIENKISSLLALTGVNSISPLEPFWKKNRMVLRIMNRIESLETLESSGFPASQVVFYDDTYMEDEALFLSLNPEAIFIKESGETSGYARKVETAHRLGITSIILRKPDLSYLPSETVYGKHGLRQAIEGLLPPFFCLHTGYTTGSSATAAAKAALFHLLRGEKCSRIDITLPKEGERFYIPITDSRIIDKVSAEAIVRKKAGDDPDVTNGIEVHAKVALTRRHNEIRFLPGEGVGIVTLPGLGLPIGAPAINKTPREMITRELKELLTLSAPPPLRETGVEVTISIPEGERIARQTYNPKLGIIGGISVIGTSGIVKPFSNEAFINAIRKEMEVAKALGIQHLVLNSGAKSERYLKENYPDYLPQAFIQYGNFIGEALSLATEMEMPVVTLGVMIGKAVKLAEGILDTHSKKSKMNIPFLLDLARRAGCTNEESTELESMVMAREIWQILPDTAHAFYQEVLQNCYQICRTVYPKGQLLLFLVSEDGLFISNSNVSLFS